MVKAGDTRVVHVSDNVPGAVYIGRANGRKRLKASPFGNPFKLPNPCSRRERLDTLIEYERYVLARPDLLARLPELRGRALACYCHHDGDEETADNACHGGVLRDLLARYTDDELRAMAE